MSATAQQLLDAVNDAIHAKLLGNAVQSYRIGDRDIQYMSLTELRRFRKELAAEVATGSGRNTNYAQFVRPQ
jgi:hypothetical protein